MDFRDKAKLFSMANSSAAFAAFTIQINAIRIRTAHAIALETLRTIAFAQGIFAEQTFQGEVYAAKLRSQVLSPPGGGGDSSVRGLTSVSFPLR
jgi:hypothetical protein